MTDKQLLIPLDVSNETAIKLFTEPEAFSDLYGKIVKAAEDFEPDMATAKGRDELRSFAAKITTTKTTLDGMGKELTEDWRKKVDAVDKVRKQMRDDLVALKEKTRKPLTQFETAEKAAAELIDENLNRIQDLKRVPFNATVADIGQMIDELAQLNQINDWGKHADEAAQSLEDTLKILEMAKKSAEQRVEMEAEAEAMKQEREEIAAEKREAEAQELKRAAELERQEKEREEADAVRERETKRLKDEAAAAEKRAQEAEAAAAAVEQRAKDERARAEQEATERAERELAAKVEAERQEKLAAQKRKEEAEAAERAERERQEQLKAEFEQNVVALAHQISGFVTLQDKQADNIAQLIITGKLDRVSFD